MNEYTVIGATHTSLIYANSEEEARRAFATWYNGETITRCRLNERFK